MKKICAGIVTYNPDISRLKENICSVDNQVNMIFLFDNGSDNVEKIELLLKELGGPFEIEKNGSNSGIAFALNRLIEKAYEKHYDWMLTLDQDTVVNNHLIEKYTPFLNMPDVGLLSCQIKDRNVNIEPKKMPATGYQNVKKCITSGTLTNIKKTLDIGGFDEKLFIDCVDDDICYTMKENGYRTIQINYIGILHEIGKSKAVKLGKNVYAVNNHNVLRKYYISRNSVYMIKKHKLNPIKEYFYIYRRFLTVLFFEKNKKEKIVAMLKGIKDGKKM